MPFSEEIPRVVLRVRLSCPFSSSVKPNCSHQFATAPWILSWFTEWIVRNKSSVFDEAPLMWTDSLPFFLLRIPRLKALMLLDAGWPESLNLCTTFLAVESHARILRTQKRPVSLQESYRIILYFFCIRLANLIVSFLCTISVVEHGHEDDAVRELFRFDALPLQTSLDLFQESAIESW